MRYHTTVAYISPWLPTLAWELIMISLHYFIYSSVRCRRSVKALMGKHMGSIKQSGTSHRWFVANGGTSLEMQHTEDEPLSQNMTVTLVKYWMCKIKYRHHISDAWRLSSRRNALKWSINYWFNNKILQLMQCFQLKSTAILSFQRRKGAFCLCNNKVKY